MTVPFQLTINSSTLRPYNLTIHDQLRVASDAGFAGIEIWVRDLQAWMAAGKTAGSLHSLADELGIQIVNGIAFFKWTDADAGTRRTGLEQAAHEIAALLETGCRAVAAPPTGTVDGLSLEQIARNFEQLLRIARPLGAEPILEFWGRSPVLHAVRQVAEVLGHVAAEGPRPTMLLDLYHMYTGGSPLEEVEELDGEQIGLVHINDYPADPPRERITDADRVMPGDGIGPVTEFLRLLERKGFDGPVSIELFRESYGHETALETAVAAREAVERCWAG